jgi:hypothetical protein
MQQDAEIQYILFSVFHKLFMPSNFLHPELPLSLYEAPNLSSMSLVADSHFATFANAKALHGTPCSATISLLPRIISTLVSRVLHHPPVIHFPTGFSTSNHLCILPELSTSISGPSKHILFPYSNSCKGV